MTTVTTQVARKDYPSEGIKKGDTYFKWEFRFGGTYRSKTYPKPSQLTQSKVSGALAAGEVLEAALTDATCIEDITAAIEDAVSDIREVADEYQESVDNMPEGLQEGPTGQDCLEKADNLNEWADDLENALGDIESLDASDYAVEEKEGEVTFDSLNDDEKAAMLEAAREMVDTTCPI